VKKALKLGFIELVFYSAMPRSSCTADKFMDAYEGLEDLHLQSEYMLDGVIFDIMNEDLRKSLGSTSHHPVWRLAKKKVKNAKPVTPINIRWQVGRTKSITPVLEIKPTVLSRVTVTSITGHSLGFIKKHGLGVGSTFLAHRAGDVIPSFLESIDRIDPEYPKICPCCESLTTIRIGKDKDNDPCDYLECTNDFCGGSTVSYLFHAFKRLGIDLFGTKSCEKLVDKGITTLEQIFNMKVENFEQVGFGPGQSLNFINEIAERKTYPLKDSELLASLGINLLGRGKSEKILKFFKVSELDKLDYKTLLGIEGFAEISAKTIISGLTDKRKTLDFLLKQNFYISHTIDTNTVVNENNGLAGLNVVFTGKMVQGNRKGMEADAKSKGAKVQTSVNGKTDLLVAGEKAGSKLAKAEKFGVKTITEQQYTSLYG